MEQSDKVSLSPGLPFFIYKHRSKEKKRERLLTVLLISSERQTEREGERKKKKKRQKEREINECLPDLMTETERGSGGNRQESHPALFTSMKEANSSVG